MRFATTAAPVLALATTVLGATKSIAPPPIDFDPRTSQKTSQCWSDMVPEGTDWYIMATVPKRDMDRVCRNFMVDLMTRQHWLSSTALRSRCRPLYLAGGSGFWKPGGLRRITNTVDSIAGTLIDISTSKRIWKTPTGTNGTRGS
ncbi:hypothetical protein LX32DRAFT_717432 [Colletotrichum zoysiae]|uniref:Uncharacterized protein n=1 Tax=Colletotrichum zoysiae TaxID=1216348 RepID=A0AAD9HLG0_9PEZI|nr:hypothetical protein LX32DRAFT_717432 [Colletotrichum zoysiae]